MVVVQEGEGTSVQEEGLWDPSLDVLSFLKKVLLPNKAKEKLINTEEDRLVGEVISQLGASTCYELLSPFQTKRVEGVG